MSTTNDSAEEVTEAQKDAGIESAREKLIGQHIGYRYGNFQ